jgi:Na+/melibiose symporter-like transporter
MIAGTVVTLLACYFLFQPPAHCGIVYFAVWRLVYDIGWTMTTVTFSAWGAELSSDYGERSRINGYSGVSTNLGVVIKNLAPILLFWFGITKTSAFSLEMFRTLYWVFLPIIVFLTLVSVVIAPTGAMLTKPRLDLAGTLRSLRTNKPFWFYIGGFLFGSLGQGMLALLFTFYDSYLKLGPWYPYLMMGFGIVTVLAIPAWVRIARRMGKHRAYGLGMVICAISIQAFWWVDPSAHTQAMMALIGGAVLFLVAFSSACAFVAPAAMLADIVDYGTWRTGVARAGSYFAFYSLITKIAMAIGSGAGFILLGMFHYDVQTGAGNGPLATDGLLFTVLLVPGILQAIGGAIIWRFPLDGRRRRPCRSAPSPARPAAKRGDRPDAGPPSSWRACSTRSCSRYRAARTRRGCWRCCRVRTTSAPSPPRAQPDPGKPRPPASGSTH